MQIRNIFAAILVLASSSAACAVDWAHAPLACLPNRAERWKTESEITPCHCPPPELCPAKVELTKSDITIRVYIADAVSALGLGGYLLNGDEVFPKDVSVKDAFALVTGSEQDQSGSYQFKGSDIIDGYVLNAMKNVYSVDISKIHGQDRTDYRVTYVATLGSGKLDGWAANNLKLPLGLAERCCDNICPNGSRPQYNDVTVAQTRPPGSELILPKYIEGLQDQLRDISDKPYAEPLRKIAAEYEGASLLGPADLRRFLNAVKEFNKQAADDKLRSPIIQPMLDMEKRLAIEDAYLNNLQNVSVEQASCAKADPVAFIYNSREGCILAGTPITLADGSVKPIEKLKLDDVAKSNTGSSKILALSKFTQRQDYMYGLNGGKEFFTIEHPILTPQGWKAVDAKITSVKSDVKIIGSLKIGDTVLLGDGRKIKVKSIDKHAVTGQADAYNISTDGDGSFIADGYIMKSFKKMQMHY